MHSVFDQGVKLCIAGSDTQWHLSLLALVNRHFPRPRPPCGVAADSTPPHPWLACSSARKMHQLVVRHPLPCLQAVWPSDV